MNSVSINVKLKQYNNKYISKTKSIYYKLLYFYLI